MKDEETLRDRLPLGQFLDLVENSIVRGMSIERDPTTQNNKAWQWEPKVELKDYTCAYQWLSEKKDIVALYGKHFVPAGTKIRLLESEVKAFWNRHTKCTWRNFDVFALEESRIWYVELFDSNWKLGKCSCPHFLKHFMCKHLIALSASLELAGCSIPLSAKGIGLGQKRKRGAPSKAKPALIRQ